MYESPHRLLKLLEDILEVYGDTQLVAAREVTKKFEEVRREKVTALIEHFNREKPRGEFILIL